VDIYNYHVLSQSKRVALAQFDSGGDDERVSPNRSSSIVENWLSPQFKRGHREYPSPFSHDRAAKSVSGSAWTVAAQSHQDSGPGMNQTESAVPGLHDFDFLVGQWQAHHRKLKQRLANNHEWIEFEGMLLNQPLMGTYSNVDDTVLSVPGAPYRGVALRSFDPKTQQWSIWWLDSRTPSEPLDPPMIGGFHNGVGTFYGDDTVKGKRVRARFIWSNITPTSGHWEQADSPDEGKTWEINWVQDITRVR
jgi:hypothetical protein